MKILVEPAKCISAGTCVMSAPELFDQDDDGIVIVLDETPDAGRLEEAIRAAGACPAGVIRIEQT